MLLFDGISYLWKSIFGYPAEFDQDQQEDSLVYQQMIDDEIIELEISERLVEAMLEQYRKGSSSI